MACLSSFPSQAAGTDCCRAESPASCRSPGSSSRTRSSCRRPAGWRHLFRPNAAVQRRRFSRQATRSSRCVGPEEPLQCHPDTPKNPHTFSGSVRLGPPGAYIRIVSVLVPEVRYDWIPKKETRNRKPPNVEPTPAPQNSHEPR